MVREHASTALVATGFDSASLRWQTTLSCPHDDCATASALTPTFTSAGVNTELKLSQPTSTVGKSCNPATSFGTFFLCCLPPCLQPVAGRSSGTCFQHVQPRSFVADVAVAPADVTLTRLLVSVFPSVGATLPSYAPLLSLLPLATHALPFASVTVGFTPTVPVTLTTAALVPAAASANATTSPVATPVATFLAAAAFLVPVTFAPAPVAATTAASVTAFPAAAAATSAAPDASAAAAHGVRNRPRSVA